MIGTAVAAPLALGAFVIGYTNNNFVNPTPPTNTVQNISQNQTNQKPSETIVDLKIKGNKNSRIYHLPGCPNYNDISERHVIWFKTHEEAKARGFRMARNC